MRIRRRRRSQVRHVRLQHAGAECCSKVHSGDGSAAPSVPLIVDDQRSYPLDRSSTLCLALALCATHCDRDRLLVRRPSSVLCQLPSLCSLPTSDHSPCPPPRSRPPPPPWWPSPRSASAAATRSRSSASAPGVAATTPPPSAPPSTPPSPPATNTSTARSSTATRRRSAQCWARTSAPTHARRCSSPARCGTPTTTPPTSALRRASPSPTCSAGTWTCCSSTGRWRSVTRSWTLATGAACP